MYSSQLSNLTRSKKEEPRVLLDKIKQSKKQRHVLAGHRPGAWAASSPCPLYSRTFRVHGLDEIEVRYKPLVALVLRKCVELYFKINYQPYYN